MSPFGAEHIYPSEGQLPKKQFIFFEMAFIDICGIYERISTNFSAIYQPTRVMSRLFVKKDPF